ncbi:MAG TPA: hypothetical protein VFC10_04165 [Terriglobia bacterium]|jgi:hypothetical protein|nr:hypothetical protein [Terriglobia bacterium]
MSHVLDGLGYPVICWMRESGAMHGFFGKLRTMQNRLSPHRFGYWGTVLSYRNQRKFVQVEGKEITLIDDSWELVQGVSKPNKRRHRTDWPEERL